MDTVADFQKLSRERRMHLIATIWDSLIQEGQDIPVPDDHIEEIDQRLDDIDRNPHDSAPWHEVKARILDRAK
jgi:putative addiction module component (TIGR02574 family)